MRDAGKRFLDTRRHFIYNPCRYSLAPLRTNFAFRRDKIAAVETLASWYGGKYTFTRPSPVSWNMPLTEPYHLFLVTFGIGIFLGAVFYRADYCMAAMFRDIFLIKDFTLLRSFYFYAVLGMSLFYAAGISGFIPIHPPSMYDYPSAMNFIGGFVFGIGMVMAGGCVVGTLYKIGSGNLTSLIALGGIIAGSMVYAEFHPFFESLRKNTVICNYVVASDMIPGHDSIPMILILLISLPVFFKWKKQGKWTVTAYARGYMQPYMAAVVVSISNVMACMASGRPIGVSTLYAKIGAYIENFFIPSHLERLSYFHQDSVSAGLQRFAISGGPGPKVDAIFFTELPVVLGIVIGAFITAISLREFKVYGLPPGKQAVSVFLGGMILALGARIAGGCNVKFLLGAVPLLAFQGIVFLPGVAAGAYIGTIILRKYVLGA